MSHDSTLKIQHHQPDHDDLAGEVIARMEVWDKRPTAAAYFAPNVTITAASPSSAFMATVRKHQGRWAKEARRIFSRRVLKTVKDWVIPGNSCPTRKGRHLHRSICLTGILFANGKLLHPHQWPDRERRTDENASKSLQPVG